MNEHQVATPPSGVPGMGLPAARSSAVRAELTRVLESPSFRPSRRCQKLLVYLVEETLNGKAEALKERTVGVDVFGRTPAYDTSEDSSVRVCAGEVRKRLVEPAGQSGASAEIDPRMKNLPTASRFCC